MGVLGVAVPCIAVQRSSTLLACVLAGFEYLEEGLHNPSVSFCMWVHTLIEPMSQTTIFPLHYQDVLLDCEAFDQDLLGQLCYFSMDQLDLTLNWEIGHLDIVHIGMRELSCIPSETLSGPLEIEIYCWKLCSCIRFLL